MRFHDPWLLLLLLIVPVWWWREQRATARGGLKFSSVAGAHAATSFWSQFGPTLLAGLRGAMLALVIVALARPQIGKSESRLRTEGIDIVLAVDVSGSMLAMDFKSAGRSVDRISIVKQVVKEFIGAPRNPAPRARLCLN